MKIYINNFMKIYAINFIKPSAVALLAGGRQVNVSPASGWIAVFAVTFSLLEKVKTVRRCKGASGSNSPANGQV
jgi:glycine/serine hydroxymethyltransferase